MLCSASSQFSSTLIGKKIAKVFAEVMISGFGCRGVDVLDSNGYAFLYTLINNKILRFFVLAPAF